MAIGSLNYFSLFCQSFTGRTHLPTHAKATTSTEQRRRGRILFLSLSSNDRAFQDWSQDSRIDVRNFLTQRSIQSFIFLCEECRDPHSGKWIEDFLGTKNLLAYHGTGASFVTGFSWDVPLLEILDQPKDVMIVSAKRRGRGHGGWSKNNPYLKDRYVEFKITIDPISLTDRILAVREQLASEWAIDLEILGRANQQILDSYFQLAKNDRQIQNQDFATAPTIAFERTAVNAINNQTAFGATGSPFRKGSFDLLYNLCTQASIHRLLYLLREQGDYSNLEWIHDFYLDRLVDYFDGDLPYGRADDFVEELLLSSPSIIDGGDGKVSLTDPFGLSEKIIEIRNDIFSEWIIAMNQVPIAHQSGVRKNLLSKQIGADSTPRSNPQDDSSNSGDFQ
eukprot:CAMPEP_0201248846 /NCGR_PEP_ID=MMETSP0852-20130820/57979_1 /ASSEMBLY_ACC=CAM_ASM_000632 /TAXON_ID=183588 /ORGANISM="Pseudo-nitzschia fraudulenta, Strain WWA7" /LENGTH=392 /DNA_ID=CAMNT_0047547749 /DNA_START=126 /DNA_END=1307 /DNA_ORIENTATION=-